MRDIKMTIFEGGSSNTLPSGIIDFNEFIRLTTKDANEKKIVEKIRMYQQNGEKETASALKKQRKYVTTAGVFSYRNDDSLMVSSYNWIVPIDIDSADNPNIDWVKLYYKMQTIDSIIWMAKSPRGEGIKAIVLLEKDKYDPKEQYTIFSNIIYPKIEKVLGAKIDYRQGALSQPFYLTFDENAYINLQATNAKFDYSVVPSEVIIKGAAKGDINELKNYVELIKNREDQKWDYFGKVALLVGGYFEGGCFNKSLTEEIILKQLIEAANENKFVKDKKVARLQIIKSFRNGKKEPITKIDLSSKRGCDKIWNKIKKYGRTDNIIRISDDYYKNIVVPKANGNKEQKIQFVKRQTLIDDYTYDILENVKKYDSFCNVPNNNNYKQIINNNYNLYNKFKHEAKQGKFETIERLFKHIFSDQLEMGYDYVQLLLEKPTQTLPILCIVSIEQGTGKTTFLDFLDYLFYGNVVIISSSEFEAGFNHYFIDKLIIAIDESDLQKERNTTKIKQMATQKSAIRKAKFQNEYPIDFFGKIIIASNNERSFVNIKDDDVRYWIRKIGSVSTFDPEFEEKLKDETPAFIHFLKNRKMETDKKESRAWFHIDKMNNEYLEAAKKENKSELWYELFEGLLDWFETNPKEKCLICTNSEIKEHFLNNNPKYTSKWINRCLTDEFKINSSMSREKSSFVKGGDDKPGRFYKIYKNDIG